jgi:hypothetical protein
LTDLRPAGEIPPKWVSSVRRTRKAAGTLGVLYSDEGLTLDRTPCFDISRHIVLLILADTVFVLRRAPGLSRRQ